MWVGRILVVGAFLFSHWSDTIFESNPHSWLDITGHVDVLLFGVALILSLVNWFVTLNLAFIGVYICKMSTFKKLRTFGRILFPFAVLGHSLWVRYDLYTVPVVSVLLVYFYMHYRSKIGKRVFKHTHLAQT